MRNTLLDIRVGEADFGAVTLAAPWLLEVDPGPYAVLYAPDRGQAVFDGHDRHGLALARGDVVSLVSGRAHRLADSNASLRNATPVTLDFGNLAVTPERAQAAQSTRLLVARVPLSANPLPEVLPPLIHVLAGNRPLAQRLRQVLHLAIALADAPAGTRDPLLKRVAEILAIELTGYALSESGEDWQTELADARMQQVVGLMRVHPERSWTLAGLAAEARMSRSAFAARFRRVIGMTPLAYLRHCRVETATALLLDSDLPLYAVADRVGYRSESAFSRVFAHATGMSPARYRRRKRNV